MKSELLATSPLLALPLLALVLFIMVFVGMFIVTMKKRAPAYDPLARMPLDDEPHDPHTQQDGYDGAEKGAPR